MKLRILLLCLPLLLSLSACGQTNGHYVRVNTVTEVFFSQDSILNIVTTDTTFVDTVSVGSGNGGGQLESLDVAKRSSTSTQAVTGNWVAIPLQTEVIAGQGITYDGANQSRLTVDADGVYWVGGYVTVQSPDQRPQTVVQIRVNGVAVGNNRGSAYIRNSGVSWDYWVMEIANTPLVLSAGDYVQFYVAQVVGNTYTPSGSSAVTLDGATSEFWMAKLVGATGANGAPGTDGTDGADGLSAYEIWLSQGNTGTEAEFIASLQGEQGEPGPAGGPPGPPGEAITSDTSADGSYWRLFISDGDPYYDGLSSTPAGTAGIEFYHAGEDQIFRVYPTDDGLTVEGSEVYWYIDYLELPNGNFSQNITWIAKGLSTEIRIDTTDAKFIDSRATKRGMEYEGDYSDDLKLNDRSIPDVGTVQEMIDAGGGAPAVPEQVSFTSSGTVNAIANSHYYINSNAGTQVLTINTNGIEVGGTIYIQTRSPGGFTNLVTAGSENFVFQSQSAGTYFNGARNTLFILTWDGTDWLLSDSND